MGCAHSVPRFRANLATCFFYGGELEAQFEKKSGARKITDGEEKR